MRCQRQLADEIAEFNELWQESNADWYQRIARGLSKRTGDQSAGKQYAFFLAHAQGSLIDEYLHEIYVRKNKRLKQLTRSPRQLAELLSILWYRMAYAQDPDPKHFPNGLPLPSARPETALAE